MGTARVFQLAEVFLECEGQRNRADSRYGHGDRRHDAPPWRAIAEENGRGWSLTKSTFSEECGRSVRRRPWGPRAHKAGKLLDAPRLTPPRGRDGLISSLFHLLTRTDGVRSSAGGR